MKALQRINNSEEILFLSPSEYATLTFADTGRPLSETFPDGIAIKMDPETGDILDISPMPIAEEIGNA